MNESRLIKKGARATLKLRTGLRLTSVRGDASEMGGPPRGNSETTEGEEELYQFGKKNDVRFYDLGTRLRSVSSGSFNATRVMEPPPAPQQLPEPGDSRTNEYVEIRYEAKMRGLVLASEEVSPHENLFDYLASSVLDDQTMWAKYSKTFIGRAAEPDPDIVTVNPFVFSPANRSARQLPNCMQLPYKARSLSLSVTLNESGGSSEFSAPISEVAPEEGENPWREEFTNLAEERWSTVNVEDETVGHVGVLKVKLKSGRVTRLSVSSFLTYEEFDTASADEDSRVRVTNQPFYSAPAVPFGASSKGMRIFLVPRLLVMSREQVRIHKIYGGDPGDPDTIQIDSFAFGAWHAGRVPIAPYARLEADGDLGEDGETPIAELAEEKYLLAVKASMDRRLVANDRCGACGRVNGEFSSRLPPELYDLPGGTDLEAAANAVSDFLLADRGGAGGNPLRTNVTIPKHVWTMASVEHKPAGMLVGVVGSLNNDRRFYVWRDVTEPVRHSASPNPPFGHQGASQ